MDEFIKKYPKVDISSYFNPKENTIKWQSKLPLDLPLKFFEVKSIGSTSEITLVQQLIVENTSDE